MSNVAATSSFIETIDGASYAPATITWLVPQSLHTLHRANCYNKIEFIDSAVTV